jgi:hypothetical protein
MSRAKEKGTSVETALVNYARHEGMLSARRVTLSGGKDKGDVELIPAMGGRRSVIAECKYTSSVVQSKSWMRELDTECVNADAETGVLVVKYPGAGEQSAWRWLAMFSVDHWDGLAAMSDGRLCPSYRLLHGGQSVNTYVRELLSAPPAIIGGMNSLARFIEVRGLGVVTMPLKYALKALEMAYPVLHPLSPSDTLSV